MALHGLHYRLHHSGKILPAVLVRRRKGDLECAVQISDEMD